MVGVLYFAGEHQALPAAVGSGVPVPTDQRGKCHQNICLHIGLRELSSGNESQDVSTQARVSGGLLCKYHNVCVS